MFFVGVCGYGRKCGYGKGQYGGDGQFFYFQVFCDYCFKQGNCFIYE